MLLKFFPKEFNFFDLFENQVRYAVLASDALKEIVNKGSVDEIALKKMQNIEHQCDDATHAIIAQLNKTFITPFDREDIHALAKEIDDITDMINTITNRMWVYKINGVNPELVEFARVIGESVAAVERAVRGMRMSKKALEVVTVECVEVNRLENVGDAMRDAVLAHLFETEKDPIAVIKWKEIYEDAETILDICEDVAHVVSSILVKQA